MALSQKSKDMIIVNLEERIKKLRGEIAPLESQLDDLKEKKTELKNKRLIGTCWRYRNSIGSGDDWWLYSKVIGASGDSLAFLELEETSYRSIEIKTDYTYGKHLMVERITPSEFQRHYRRLLRKLEEVSHG